MLTMNTLHRAHADCTYCTDTCWLYTICTSYILTVHTLHRVHMLCECILVYFSLPSSFIIMTTTIAFELTLYNSKILQWVQHSNLDFAYFFTDYYLCKSGWTKIILSTLSFPLPPLSKPLPPKMYEN